MNVTSSLTAYRLLSAALALVIPIFGLLLRFFSPDGVDPLWIRFLLSGWFLCLFGLSFHSTYRKMLPRLWTVSVWAGSIWFVGVAVANAFSLQYAVGALILLPVGGSILRLTSDRRTILQWYYGIGALALGLAIHVTDLPPSFEGAYTASVVTLVLAMYLTQRSQLHAEAELRASQQKYKSLFETANDAVFVHDLDGRITDVNPQAEALFRYGADQLVGQEIANIHAPQAEDVAGWKLEKLRRGEDVNEVVRYLRKDGSTFWGDLSASALEIDGEKVARTMIRDVTQERILRRRLQEERDLLAKVLETSPVAITIVDTDGTITFANGLAEEVLGLERSEIKDRTYNDCEWQIRAVDGTEYPEEKLPFVQVMETGQPVFGVEHAIEWPDGERRQLSINGAPFREEDGRIKSVVFAMEDITERRKMETALTQSRRRLQALFDHALDMILLANDQGEYVDVNPAAERKLGYSREQLIGMNLWDLSPERTQEEGKQDLRAFLEAGRMEGEYQLETKEGNRIDMEFRAVADIQPGLHLSVLRDVTDRKRLEQQADRFFSLTLDLLCIADTDGYFSRINPAFEQVLGYGEEELLSRPFIDLVHPDDRTATRQVIEQLSGGEDIQKFVNRYRHKEGGYRWIEWHATPDPEGERIYAAARDVTSRREYEEQLRSAKEKAEEMNRLKSSFLANMSHEIRTPLTSIIGYADLLKEQVSAGEHRFVTRIEESGRRLLRTLNSVLDLAQLESGNMNVNPEVFDCAGEMRRIADTLHVQAGQKDIALRLDLPDQPLLTHMDKGIFTRIVTNLLHNAIKFTEEGYVRLGCRQSHQELALEVEDTGVGMDEEFLNELFEAFRQESMGVRRRYEGNGLGLTITKHLVDLLGGRIEVESTKGEGTLFTVSLPWSAIRRSDTDRSLTARSSGEMPELPAGRRVMIVDDDPAVAELLPQMLPSTYTFDIAGGPDEALSLVEKRTYDLMFLDINLKDDMNGEELRGRMEQMQVLADTTVIAITAYALPGDKEQLLDGGFDGYIAKPFRQKTLFDRLLQVMA